MCACTPARGVDRYSRFCCRSGCSQRTFCLHRSSRCRPCNALHAHACARTSRLHDVLSTAGTDHVTEFTRNCLHARSYMLPRASQPLQHLYTVPLHWTLMQEGGSKQPLQCRALQLRITHPVVAMLQQLLRIPARQHSRTIARSLLNPARRFVRTHVWRPVQRKLHLGTASRSCPAARRRKRAASE